MRDKKQHTLRLGPARVPQARMIDWRSGPNFRPVVACSTAHSTAQVCAVQQCTSSPSLFSFSSFFFQPFNFPFPFPQQHASINSLAVRFVPPLTLLAIPRNETNGLPRSPLNHPPLTTSTQLFSEPELHALPCPGYRRRHNRSYSNCETSIVESDFVCRNEDRPASFHSLDSILEGK